MGVKPSYDALARRVSELEREAALGRRAEAALREQNRALDRRAKELNCLYELSNLVEPRSASVKKIVRGAAELIAAVRQHPEHTCVRIVLAELEYKTKNFEKTSWKLVGKIMVEGETVGAVTVYRLGGPPAHGQGAFAKEEKALINEIAGRLGRIATWIWTTQALQSLKEKYEDLYNNSPAMYMSLDCNGRVVECNHTILEKLGYTRAQLVGRDMASLVTPRSAADFRKNFPELIETGKVTGAERQLVARSGEIIETLLNATVDYDKTGKALRTRASFEDITRRKQAEAALRRSEEKYRLVVENAMEGILVAQDGWIKLANPKVLEYTGWSEQAIMSRPFADLVHPEDKKGVIENHSKMLTGDNDTGKYTLRAMDRAGQIRWIENNRVRIDWEGRPATLNFMTDITERRQMEKALRTSEAQKRTILDASPNRVRLVDKDLKIIWANQTTAKTLKIPREALAGRACYEVLAGRETPCQGCPTVKALETGETERSVIRQPGAKGMNSESFWANYSAPLKNENGEVESLVQVAQDITLQVRAEKQIRYLTQELMKAQETERQRLARDLHDNLAQDLSLLKIDCETLFDEQPAVPAAVRQKIADYSERFQKAITAVRDMAYEIHPPGLNELGFVPSIAQYCDDFYEKNGTCIDFHAAGIEGLELDFDTQINLYRIIQEGLNNIHKHANGAAATIRLVAAWPNIILRIEDDGRGFDVERRLGAAVAEKRMGIRSIKERAGLLGGTMTIQSRPDTGTRIFIKIPCQEKKNGPAENHIDR